MSFKVPVNDDDHYHTAEIAISNGLDTDGWVKLEVNSVGIASITVTSDIKNVDRPCSMRCFYSQDRTDKIGKEKIAAKVLVEEITTETMIRLRDFLNYVFSDK